MIGVAETGTVAGVADPGPRREIVATDLPRSAPKAFEAATAEVETRRPRRVRVDGDPTPSTPAVATARCGNLPGIIEELE